MPVGVWACAGRMQGWNELSKNPAKMQELMQSFKDPEVMAKAKEMLNDPT